MLLFTPGPTPIPESIRQAMATPTLHHRTKEFEEIFAKARWGLKTMLKMPEVLMLASSGTGAMEASILQFCSAKLCSCNRHCKNKPENAHYPGIIPQIICQTANHGTAKRRSRCASDRTRSRILAVADNVGRSLNIPQHSAHKSNDAQQTCLNPHLQVKIVGMDKRCLAMVQVEIRDIRLCGSRSQACACHRRFFDNFQRCLIQRDPTGC